MPLWQICSQVNTNVKVWYLFWINMICRNCTWWSELLGVERRKCKLSEVFCEGQLDIHQTLWSVRDGLLALCSSVNKHEQRLFQRQVSHLVLLLDAREGCPYLRVAAPIIGITYNGHHFEFIQRPDEGWERHSCMLLRQCEEIDCSMSGSKGTNQQYTRSLYSYLPHHHWEQIS